MTRQQIELARAIALHVMGATEAEFETPNSVIRKAAFDYARRAEIELAKRGWMLVAMSVIGALVDDGK